MSHVLEKPVMHGEPKSMDPLSIKNKVYTCVFYIDNYIFENQT